MEAKDFINKEYFNLTLDCNSEVLAQIYSALEEYAKTEQLRIGGVSQQRELLYAFANYVNNNELNGDEQITDYSIKKYIKSIQ